MPVVKLADTQLGPAALYHSAQRRQHGRTPSPIRVADFRLG